MSQIFVTESAKDIASTMIYAVNTTFTLAHQVYENIPGARMFYHHFLESHLNDPYRTLLEVLLIFFLFWYFYHAKYRPGANPIVLTEQEVEQLCEEWTPEPLVPALSEFERDQLEKLPITTGPVGVKVKLTDGKERTNLASFNFLGLMNRDEIKEKASAALRKYGVGSCGPPGFYGTIDVHMELEQAIAKFFEVDAAIIYSHGFSTIASCIPAFAKRGVSLATQKGLDISRSQIRFFKHNDMNDLEKTLQKITQEDIKVALARKYKFRIILEESFSLGALGKTGRGVTEYYGIPAKEIDIIAASMSNALGGSGGFVCGSDEVVEHQRLSGQAYVFSASMPALLAVSAIEALKLIDAETPKLTEQLAENVKLFRQLVSKNLVGVRMDGAEDSPIIHFRLKATYKAREEEEKLLQEVVDLCMKDGLLCSRAKYTVPQELHAPKPSIRVVISAGLTKKDVEKSANTIKESFRKLIK